MTRPGKTEIKVKKSMNATTPEVAAETITEALLWRYATKKFDSSKKIEKNTIELLKYSLRYSPSSFGLQPWKFYHVKEPSLRAALRDASWDQPQVTDASDFFVLAAKNTITDDDISFYIERLASGRGVLSSDLAPFKQMIVGFIKQLPTQSDIHSWCIRQVYLALGMVLSTASLLKIDACPMEGLDPKKYGDLLNCSAHGVTPAVAVAIGYRAKDDSYASYKKVRFLESEVFVEL